MTGIPPIRTRKPTGKPPWPLLLLAGGEKTGKSWAAAEFSASDLIGQTFFIEVGEHYADEYGAIPGARFEIVEHDGTYRGIGNAVWSAARQPRGEDGKPNCIILDSASVLWEQLSSQAHRRAYDRWRKNHPHAPEPDEEVVVTQDLWNVAKERFGDIINMLRQHDGPVIITARLEEISVVIGGKPTTDRTWKVKAEKNLPFDVDMIIESRTPRTWEARGVRSVRYQLEPGKSRKLPNFTVDGFLREVGLGEAGATSARSVTLTRPPAPAGPEPERFATPKQQQELAQLLAVKLGITDPQVQLAEMSKRLRRRLRSMADVPYAQAETAVAGMSTWADFIPRAEQLRTQLSEAPLEQIDPLMHEAGEALDAHQITPEEYEELAGHAEMRASALIGQASAQADWTAPVGQPIGAGV